MASHMRLSIGRYKEPVHPSIPPQLILSPSDHTTPRSIPVMADEETRPAKAGDTSTPGPAYVTTSAIASRSASASAPGPEPAALQVIILGSQGGPLETNCTAFLVRSLATGWRKGSLMAVDAGVHLGAITRILEKTQPPNLGQTEDLALPYVLQSGPFAGLKVHSASAKTNAARIQGDLIDTYLVTHPHLDHISGFVINTAGLAGPRRKKLAGLPTTIQALKTHIFNNVIWPNLSDEDHGAGLFTYMRLNEGGFPGMGNVDGYLEFNEGLAVKTWSVSHGHLVDRQQHRGSVPSTRFGSLDGLSGPMAFNTGMLSPRSVVHTNVNPSLTSYFQQHQVNVAHERAQSIMPLPGSGGLPGPRAPSGMNPNGNPNTTTEVPYVYDSSSYFIRDVETGVEVLIFGDVESDSVSMHPRNLHIWQEAAPKIAEGKLKAILIECSYDDSRPVDRLFGHLTPSFLIEEMTVLANEVKEHRTRQAIAREEARRSATKRKRDGGNELTIAGRRRATRALTRDWASTGPGEESVSPRSIKAQWLAGSQGEGTGGPESPPPGQTSLEPGKRAYAGAWHPSVGGNPTGAAAAEQTTATVTEHAAASDDVPQLTGVKIVIIHMKDTMNDDQPVGEIIYEELLEHETFMETPLGCEWIISEVGQSLML